MKLFDNVKDFLDECSREVGDLEKGMFKIERCAELEELEIESPIEQILYCALKAVQRFNSLEDIDTFEAAEGWVAAVGLDIRPQFRVGKYRVDFFISWRPRNLKLAERKLIVECDSQEFHERDERERRYEKTRDRFLLSRGYKVFHYTGTEILIKPREIAAEILCELVGAEIDSDWR